MAAGRGGGQLGHAARDLEPIGGIWKGLTTPHAAAASATLQYLRRNPPEPRGSNRTCRRGHTRFVDFTTAHGTRGKSIQYVSKSGLLTGRWLLVGPTFPKEGGQVQSLGAVARSGERARFERPWRRRALWTRTQNAKTTKMTGEAGAAAAAHVRTMRQRKYSSLSSRTGCGSVAKQAAPFRRSSGTRCEARHVAFTALTACAPARTRTIELQHYDSRRHTRPSSVASPPADDDTHVGSK